MRFVWLLTLIAGLAPIITQAAEPLPRSVLILDQSEPNSQWGFGFRAGLRSVLDAEATESITIYSEILDLGRFKGKDYEALLRVYLDHSPRGYICQFGNMELS